MKDEDEEEKEENSPSLDVFVFSNLGNAGVCQTIGCSKTISRADTYLGAARYSRSLVGTKSRLPSDKYNRERERWSYSKYCYFF